MQKQQVFKVKGMQRDASMANANGEFAYEILNMRLMPAEDLSGFSLTNEKGTLATGITLDGQVIGQCPTNDSLVVFTTSATYNENDERTGGLDYIYEIYQTSEGWTANPLYQGDLNFHVDKHIEALFNYETEDIQKVYWIDGINQLRCINIAPDRITEIQSNNDTQFDSVKEINNLPSIEIERVEGGNFTAGVVQYYVTYFNKNASESPIVYTSPLLYIAHDDRGANVNDPILTAFKFTFTDLDTINWRHIRIYVTHRTSIDATPEASIATELSISNTAIEWIDYGTNRTSIVPTDLYFTGSKFTKVGTMTVKDQVLFLGNLNIKTPQTIPITEIQQLFETIRNESEHPFTTTTIKTRENKISEYDDTHYYYNNQLNNTTSITHYKYGEKYRFGISVSDKYGNWYNPIWIKDAFIEVSPRQVDSTTLALPCPSLNLSYILDYENVTKSLGNHLADRGVVSIKPIVVFPREEERKVIAQGVVCPTVYNFKDRKDNAPYAQASWFMRPNVPADIWGISADKLNNTSPSIILQREEGNGNIEIENVSHKIDILIEEMGKTTESNLDLIGYYGVANTDKFNNGLSAFDYLYDDFILDKDFYDEVPSFWKSKIKTYTWDSVNEYMVENTDRLNLAAHEMNQNLSHGSWLEFRHNYALRAPGASFGSSSENYTWKNSFVSTSSSDKYGMVRAAELEPVNSFAQAPVNRFPSTSLSMLRVYREEYNPNAITFLTTRKPVVGSGPNVGETIPVYVCYKHVYENNQYMSIVQTTNVYFSNKYITLSGGNYIDAVAGDCRLTLRYNYKNTIGEVYMGYRDFRNAEKVKYPDGNYYYEWNIDLWEMPDFTALVDHVFPNYIDFNIVGVNQRYITFGNKSVKNLSLGNSVYYVDNSIVTLNSPDIEVGHNKQNLDNEKFRIIGMIPLTATSSDISVITESASYDPIGAKTGLVKRYFSNKNIGYHGFKGMVAANAYSSYYGEVDDAYIYFLTPLYPWSITGSLNATVSESDDPSYKAEDILKNKIISNLRFSASTFYFEPGKLGFKALTSDSYSDRSYLGDQVIGWEPAAGAVISAFTGENDNDIIKLKDLGYGNDIVYQGSISTIANNTIGDSNAPISTIIYSFGQLPKDSELIPSTDIDLRINLPAYGDATISKEVGGSSIRYKSSPHYVIGFKCYDSLWGSTQKIQETLPAWTSLNEEGISSLEPNVPENKSFKYGTLYENENIASIYHQQSLFTDVSNSLLFGLPETYITYREVGDKKVPNYGWLWLGEIYRQNDPTFGGTSPYNLQNNMWENAGNPQDLISALEIEPYYEIGLGDTKKSEFSIAGSDDIVVYKSTHVGCRIDINNPTQSDGFNGIKLYSYSKVSSDTGLFGLTGVEYNFCILKKSKLYKRIVEYLNQLQNSPNYTSNISFSGILLSEGIAAVEDKPLITYESKYELGGTSISEMTELVLEGTKDSDGTVKCSISIICSGTLTVKYTAHDIIDTSENPLIFSGRTGDFSSLKWTQGDTYYQRFDTLKTYADSDSADNSVVDITSFMVETHINIDGRTDRNRGQESNLQMSPTNFNLMNDVYSQRDNFFTYRILDDDLQNRTNFPNQITWSLTKTAGATLDAWLNITLASVLDLDGTKGELTALKNFNNNIIAFQEKGLSHIMFNSRAQIATSEAVPIQIANTGKVDGQQYFTTDVGCQDKWNIVTTPNGLYFVDYFNKNIYKFNGQLEDISTPNGFRSWCYENLNSTANILGYYDVKNKEVMYYIGDTGFKLSQHYLENESLKPIKPTWLGFSELTGTFSSFYTYPKAMFADVRGQGLWLLSADDTTIKTQVYTHQTGEYNQLLNTSNSFYGITVIPRQNSNIVKIFNNVEFRADSYIGSKLGTTNPFDTISAETEYQPRTTKELTYNHYRPSNLKKKFRTWRANIPRVSNGYERFVNQWAEVGLWKMKPSIEKTILHDLAVWYSE